MKNIIYSITLLLSFFMMVSCRSSQTITVFAVPGTKIYTPDDMQAARGTVPPSGKLKVRLSVKPYVGYMLAEMPQSNLKIPFGLDYKSTGHTGEALSGVGISIAPAMTIVGACILPVNVGAGAGILATGIAFGTYSTLGILKQPTTGSLQNEMSFSYEKEQKAIQDIPLAAFVEREDPPRPIPAVDHAEKISRKKASSGSISSEVHLSKASKSRKFRNDLASAVVGEYIGAGTLKSAGTTDESYDYICVSIVRVDKTIVRVRIIENGEDFFESPMEYMVTRKKDGSYLLTLHDIPSAKIILTSLGELIYIHDKVNIDNSIYTLSIDAHRK